MDLNLNGRRALVTGASRGIGRQVALSLAREGCHVVLVARTAADLDAVRQEIRGQSGVEVETVAADLGDLSAVEAIASRYPETDLLVNNAGAIPHGQLLEVSDDVWQTGWQLKVHGTIRMSRCLYEHMKRRRFGVIVNVIGLAGERLNGNYIIGSAGNASLIAFTRALGSVSTADGIRVVGINPGVVLTDRTRKRLEKRAADTLGDAARWQELTRHLPFGRPAHPQEIADAVCFLASDRAGYITGTTLTIDGGVSNKPVEM